jgi:hypothetical protein
VLGRVVYRTASGHRRDCLVARGVVLHGDDLGVTERDEVAVSSGHSSPPMCGDGRQDASSSSLSRAPGPPRLAHLDRVTAKATLLYAVVALTVKARTRK